MKKNRSLEKTKSRAGMMMVAPSIILLLIFIIYPIFDSFILSLYDWNFLSNAKTFVGFGNYIKAFEDSRFWNAFSNTLYFTGVYVPLLVIFSLFLALLINSKIPGFSLFQTDVYKRQAVSIPTG